MTSMDDVSRITGLLLLAKGRELPTFLSNLRPLDRLAAVQAINDVHAIGSSLYDLLLRCPSRFFEEAGEPAYALLDRAKEIAEEQIATFSEAQAAMIVAVADRSDVQEIIDSIRYSGREARDIIAAEDAEARDDTMFPQPTSTTNRETLKQMRQAGMQGLN